MKPHALLLIGCSQRKAPGLAEGRAWDLYDGTLYRVLKNLFRTRPELRVRVEILIVSARHGIVTPDAVITTYNERLTPELTLERGDFWESGFRACLVGRRFQAAHVNLGRHYVRALPGLARLLAPARIDWASGGIGTRSSQTRQWVEARPLDCDDVG